MLINQLFEFVGFQISFFMQYLGLETHSSVISNKVSNLVCVTLGNLSSDGSSHSFQFLHKQQRVDAFF